MSKLIDLTGRVFGRLLVTGRVPSTNGQARWACVCDCGKTCTAVGQALRDGLYISCGCYRLQMMHTRAVTHGASRTRAYRVWATMRQRCRDPNATSYPNYGARGITVCTRWGRFENFIEDMGEPPEGASIERRNNDKGYTPANCYWATRKEQAANTRTNRYVSVGTLRLHVAQWGRESGVSEATIRKRSDGGWPPEAAVLLPSIYTWGKE